MIKTKKDLEKLRFEVILEKFKEVEKSNQIIISILLIIISGVCINLSFLFLFAGLFSAFVILLLISTFFSIISVINSFGVNNEKSN